MARGYKMILKEDGTPLTTDRDVYEYVVTYLKKQKSRSVDENNDCRYRGFTDAFKEELYDSIPDSGDEIINYENWIEALSDKPYNASCAAGCLIEDRFYDVNFEGNKIDSDIFEAIVSSNPLWNRGLFAFKMIEQLQSIHDDSEYDIIFTKYAQLENKFDSNNNYFIL